MFYDIDSYDLLLKYNFADEISAIQSVEIPGCLSTAVGAGLQ